MFLNLFWTDFDGFQFWNGRLEDLGFKNCVVEGLSEEEELLSTKSSWAKSSPAGWDSLAVEDFNGICEKKGKCPRCPDHDHGTFVWRMVIYADKQTWKGQKFDDAYKNKHSFTSNQLFNVSL